MACYYIEVLKAPQFQYKGNVQFEFRVQFI